jgi:arabinose-5-phosphate isomerase
MDAIERAKQVIGLEIDGLRKVQAALGADFAAAVDVLRACVEQGGKIVVTGIGKNYHIAMKVSATLTSTGSRSIVLNCEQAMHGDIGILNAGDVLLALSYSGESEELLNLLPIVKHLQVPIVAVTGAPESALARQSDRTVCVAIDKEACPFNLAPTVSTTATLAVGDALAMALLDAREFTRDDYARLHPGGAIGRTLLLKARDVMRTGERLAAVRSGEQVREALLAMTRAKAGSVGVVDGDGRLLGIFTDGDLRRQLTRHDNILAVCIDDVMTRHPITVRGDQMAVEVVAIYSRYEIDDLLVVDGDGRLIGLIDIQQLPKLKIL